MFLTEWCSKKTGGFFLLCFLLGMAISTMAAHAGDAFYTPASPTNRPILSDTPEAAPEQETEVNLLHVTSDAMPGFGTFAISINEANQILQMRYYPYDDSRRDYPLTQLKDGIVLLRQGNFDVVKIKSNSFTPMEGGAIDLIYLENGILKSYGTFKMELMLSGNHWVMRTLQESKIIEFSSIFFQKRELFGKVIGIQKVIIK